MFDTIGGLFYHFITLFAARPLKHACNKMNEIKCIHEKGKLC